MFADRMKLMRVNLSMLFVFSLIFYGFGQNVNYQIRLTEIMATADNNDVNGSQDPTFYIYYKDNGTNANAVTAWQPTGCIYLADNTFGAWWSGTPNQGVNIPFNWNTVNNTDATQINTELEGFEKDCLNDNCTYDGSCSIWDGLNDDDTYAARTNSGNFDFTLDAPCQWNEYELINSDYHAHIEVYWEYVALDPGTVDGDQFVCVNGDPTVLGSLTSGTPAVSSFVTYQWQQDVGCTGSFVDIAGATSATYDPPLGFIQQTCFRRAVTYACGTEYSNTVTVDIEQPSTAPTSITASPTSLCGSGNVTLSVNGGTLGTGASWEWYLGDPNASGVSIGSGASIVYNMLSTGDVYVRAEGNCSITSTVNQTIVVNGPSTSPTSLVASQTTICFGGSVDLTAVGGILGTGANYAWYITDPLVGNPAPVFTSTSTNFTGVSPVTTTTYYVRIEGCDTTGYVSVQIDVNSLSNDPTGVSSSSSSVCSGSPVTLTVNGGSLGTGADWYWYQGGCGAGAPVATSQVVTFNPTSTTTYYVRAEGTCNNSACASITVLVDDNSQAPTTVLATNSSICPGDQTVLSIAGGSLGTGADWQWYNGACGGTPIGSGATLAITPSVTSTYYVRAEGTCNTTTCANTTITVENASVAATGATVSLNNICSNTSTTLNVNGGTLGSGASWEWYSGSCGGIYVGSGASLNITPSSTTTYYVRAEGTCNTTNCENVTVTILPSSTAPSAITATNTSVCPGGSTTLSVTGGNLATGDQWVWYEAGCGAGTSLGTGTSITVQPSVQTTYYVRAEGTCGSSACASLTISMDDVSTAPTSMIASNTAICTGSSVVLSVSGGSLGTGATWQWYSGSCGGSPVGSGNSISVTPSATTSYFVRAEGTCGNSNCIDETITVGAGVPDPSSAEVTVDNICPGEETQVYVVGNALPSGYSWVWYTGACGAVTVGVGDTITVSPTATETYYVRSVGTCGETNCVSVDVNVQNGSVAADGITASNNNFCQGESTTLTVDGGSLVAGADWVWYENSCGGNQVGTGASVILIPSNSTSYYVRAEGGTCGPTACENIFISVIETVVHCNPFDTICGTPGAFTLEGGEPVGGTYSGDGVSGGVFNPQVAGNGTHTISYVYTAANGCSDTAKQNLVVVPTDMTAIIVMDQLTCSQGGVTLSVDVQNSEGFISYFWSDGDYNDVKTFVQEGFYSVQVQDAEGCVVNSDTVEVTEEMECIDIPNTFTPNSDGKNDTWNLDFSAFSDVELIVFTKWGREVFTTSDLIVSWNGTTKGGKDLPAAVYYYTLSLNGGEFSQTGTITILR